ncbi:MAG TPA: N-acetylneuraminate lyase [Clostridia bacterium]|nr:N-acetylneuraminate lyase [Clostridia bacterium]
MNEKYNGIFPALLTAFTFDDRIDEKAIRRLVRYNLDKGVKGFYVCGSSGEAFLLSPQERKRVLEVVADEVSGEATIIAHIGSIATHQSIDLASHAKAVGADAISSIPPFYYKFSYEEIKNYYFDILNSVDLPMIMYNFPDASGFKMDTEKIAEFLKDNRILGIKHTCSDFYMLERFKQIRPDTVVFNGFDEMFLSGLAAGADGAIGTTYNAMAEKFIQIYKLYSQGKMNEALEIQRKANNILQKMIKFGVLPSEKAILEIQGLNVGVCRKPFRKLAPEEYKALEKVLAENE